MFGERERDCQLSVPFVQKLENDMDNAYALFVNKVDVCPFVWLSGAVC